MVKRFKLRFLIGNSALAKNGSIWLICNKKLRRRTIFDMVPHADRNSTPEFLLGKECFSQAKSQKQYSICQLKTILTEKKLENNIFIFF